MRKDCDMISGRKTYIIAALMVAFALGAGYLGQIPPEATPRMVLEGGGLAALRAGIAKI